MTQTLPDWFTDWSWMTHDRGQHYVYHLAGRLPGVDPEEAVAHIYVGVTSDIRQRIGQHRRKWWWVAVVPELCEFLLYPTRSEAEEWEREHIRLYQPAMNRAGRLLVVSPA